MNYAEVSDSATLAGEAPPPDLDSMYATPAQKKKKKEHIIGNYYYYSIRQPHAT